MQFSGWTPNNTDSAVWDGIFTADMAEREEGAAASRRSVVRNPEDLNRWGLLPDEETCNKYLGLNRRGAGIWANGEKVETGWQPLAVYCGKYTLDKPIPEKPREH